MNELRYVPCFQAIFYDIMGGCMLSPWEIKFPIFSGYLMQGIKEDKTWRIIRFLFAHSRQNPFFMCHLIYISHIENLNKLKIQPLCSKMRIKSYLSLYCRNYITIARVFDKKFFYLNRKIQNLSTNRPYDIIGKWTNGRMQKFNKDLLT
jgi:hypothetical protein